MRKVFVLVTASVLFLGLAVPTRAVEPDPRLVPPGATISGATQAEWLARYMIWFQEIPFDVNPAVDPLSPENCALQDGGVVFAGPSGSDCSVPADTPIAVSPFGFECSTAEGNGKTFVKLTRCAAKHFEREWGRSSVHFRMRIDGEPVGRLRAWIFATAGEIVDFPENNLWGVDPGPSKSATKAFLYMLQPLSVGSHKVVIRGSEDVFGPFRLVWKLHVEDGAS